MTTIGLDSKCTPGNNISKYTNSGIPLVNKENPQTLNLLMAGGKKGRTYLNKPFCYHHALKG